MKEPKKPVKPRKPTEPSKTLEIEWESRLDWDGYDGCTLEKVLKKMPEGVAYKDIYLRHKEGYDYDDPGYWCFSSYSTIDNEAYNAQLKRYEINLEKYKSKLADYKKAMSAYKLELEEYEKWWKKDKIESLEQELKELKLDELPMQIGDKLICLEDHAGNPKIQDPINKGDVLTIRDIDVSSTGTWISFMEHKPNKYCVYPHYLSNYFKKVDG